MTNPEVPYAPPTTPLAEPPAPRPTRLRVPAIVLIVLGLLVIVAGIAQFLPGGIQFWAGTGGAICCWGILLFGLSFVRLPRISASAEPPIPALQKVTGIFYEPSRIFKNLGLHPRWLAAFLIIAFLNVAYAAAFTKRLTPERIVGYLTEKMAQTPFIPPEAVERAKVTQLEQLTNPIERVGTAAKSVVGAFFWFAFLAVLYLLGVLVFGGRINYWQAFVVAVYGTLPVIIIQRIVSLILLYIKSPDDIHPILGQETLVQDNLGVLFSSAEHPVLFVTASAIGILSFYGLWLKATGLRNAGERVSKAAAWSTAILFWVLGLAVIIIITAVFPAFVS